MNALISLNQRGWDWQVLAWDGWTLTLMGDMDLTYHHEVEVRFGGVTYVSTPQTFYSPQFRLATDEEVATLRYVIEPGDLALVIAWDADTGVGHGTSIVVAESVEVVEGHVPHRTSAAHG